MYELTPEQKALRARARELAQREFAPTAADTDRTEAYPWDNVAKLRDAGFMGMTIPRDLGGRGLSYLDTVLVIEEMAKACATMGRITVEANMGAIGAIIRYGTDEQRRLAAAAVLSGDKPAICISEPAAGSAASEMTTRADRHRGHYYLNGEKHWITGGGVSRLHLIFARVFDDGQEQGIGAFICVRDGEDSPRELVVTKRTHAMGVRGIPETHIEFHDLKIHKSMLVVPPGGLARGFAELMRAYNAQLVGAGTVALGFVRQPVGGAVVPFVVDGQFRTDRPCGDLNPVLWLILTRYGLPVRGPAVADLGLLEDLGALRQFNLDNLRA